MTVNTLLRYIGLEVLVWFAAPAAFLTYYFIAFNAPPGAISDHLVIAGMPLLALTAMRALTAILLPRNAINNVTQAFTITLFLSILLIYYLLVITGLVSWGRVISWELILSYASQASYFASTIGISLTVCLSIIAIVCLLIFSLAFWHVKRRDWMSALAKKASWQTLLLVFIAGTIIPVAHIYNYFTSPPSRNGEPVRLTFSEDAQALFENNKADTALLAYNTQQSNAARNAYVPFQPEHPKNLILIVVDALRADHMGIYGYKRNTTPTLAALESRGLLHKAPPLHTSCAESYCGLLSMASSQYVHQASESPFTLQEILKKSGYSVHLILGGDHTRFYGLRKIYGEVDSYFDGSMTDRYMNDDRFVLDKVKHLPAWNEKPVMLQFHLMSTHMLGTREPQYLYDPDISSYATHSNDLATAKKNAINYYDSGVLQTDAYITEILAQLENKGYLRHAVVAITADHGEELGEHGLFGHSKSTHEAVLKVPLLLAYYGYTPKTRIDNIPWPAQIDIAPTLLEELQLPVPKSFMGIALQHPADRQYTYFQQGNETGLLANDNNERLWKYIVRMPTGEESIFDVLADPGESNNLINSVPAKTYANFREKLSQAGPLPPPTRQQ